MTPPNQIPQPSYIDLPNWQFDKQQSVDKEDNDDEHFKSADNTLQALIRECLSQNPNGAAKEGSPSPVEVRYFVSGPERAIPLCVASRYFGSLHSHLQVCSKKSFLHPEVLSRDCEYILIEDFNTTGATGDINKRHEPAGSGNNFYGLFRSAGKSTKNKGGGSWGVGKRVMNMSSSIGAFIGYSVRHSDVGQMDDTPRVLMGRAILTTHELNGVAYTSDAFLAEWPGSLPMPITDTERLNTFVNDWRISRTPIQTGFSALIPYTSENVESDPYAHVFYTTAETYGQILSRKLIVHLDVPGIQVTVDASTLTEFITKCSEQNDKYPWRELLSRVQLAEWALGKSGASSTIQLPEVTEPTSLDSYICGLPEETTANIHSTFMSSQRALIHIPVVVKRKQDGRNAVRLNGHLKVALERELANSEGIYPDYFRDWIRIGVGHRNRKKGERPMGRKISQVRSIEFVVDGPENGLAQLLRASEGIAHAKWGGNTKGFGEWEEGETWINFAKFAPVRLADVARGLTSEMNYSAFPFFASPDDAEPTAPVQPGGPNPPPLPPPPPQPSFRVTRNGTRVLVSVPSGVAPGKGQLVAAYSTRSGNPMKEYSSSDFKFEDLDVAVTSGVVISQTGNRILFQWYDSSTFTLRIDGFSALRNLDVAVSANSDLGDDTE